jgi:hypothetical protein
VLEARRAAGRRAVVFRAVVRLAVLFRAAGLRAVVFRAVERLAVVFRAVGRLAVDFRAVDRDDPEAFFAVDLRVVPLPLDALRTALARLVLAFFRCFSMSLR